MKTTENAKTKKAPCKKACEKACEKPQDFTIQFDPEIVNRIIHIEDRVLAQTILIVATLLFAIGDLVAIIVKK